jgi:putative heme iron utilization protein
MSKKEITSENEFAEASTEREWLLKHFESVILSTVDDSGEPNASYAPSAIDENCNFYIYVSAMARHSANLKATGKASLMIIEDEATAATLFARKRLTLEVKVSVIKRESKKWNTAFAILENKFKKKVGMLKNLVDFDLFLLKPSEGTLVYGFGKAFRIYGQGIKQINYVRTKGGHKRKQE